ncbi:MAG: TonB-dependent receptor, partial [Phenylobacterium sp.]
YHTVAFRDDILIRPGLPELDLLDGAAIGAGGGSPRHQVDVQANYTKGGLGASLNANWQAATRVEGGPTADDLEFSDQTTVNLRLFADLGAQPIARDYRWLRGARATLSIDNLFDSRQQVRDGTGVTPVSYQPDLLDPVGRSVKLTFRKLFF